MSINFSDYPITTDKDDRLNVGIFINSLVNTITTTHTPYSISLYGEWGSGKTSILKITENKILNIKEKKYKTIWINAWEIYTLIGQNELRNLFVSKILSSLFPVSKILTEVFSNFFVDAVNIALDSFNKSTDIKLPNRLEKDLKSLLQIPIQKKFEKAIHLSNKWNNTDRVIIFVDDLDRLKPLEVLTILDAVSVFFNVKECMFVFALDHFRINNAIENMNCQNLERVYPSKYLDKIIQLNISIPMPYYDIKNFIQDILELKSIDPKFFNIIDNYTSLTLYSVGRIPRNIKKICSKFIFYKNILQQSINTDNSDNKRNFYPLGDLFLHQALFSMICFQESYECIYDLFVQANWSYKEFLEEIIFNIKSKNYISDTILHNKKSEDFMRSLSFNQYEEEKFLNFLNIFITSISVNEDTRKSFSYGGIFLVETMSKIIQKKDPYNISTYNNNLQFCIKNISILTNYFNKIFCCYLEYIKSNIICDISQKRIHISFQYLCGPFSFIFHIIYTNNILSSFIESIGNSNTYKNIIYDWVDKCCIGLPKKSFIPHNKIFIKFENILYYDYISKKYNPFKFFINTTTAILYRILDPISVLHAYNYKIIQNISLINEKLNKKINNNFKQKDGWIITGNNDILNRWCGLMISKKTWNDKLSICIEPNGYYMQDIIIGIKKSIWNGKFTDDADKKFFHKISSDDTYNFYDSSHWVIYNSAIPSSFSESTYYPGLKERGTEYNDLNLILENINIYKILSHEIEELSRKALY